MNKPKDMNDKVKMENMSKEDIDKMMKNMSGNMKNKKGGK